MHKFLASILCFFTLNIAAEIKLEEGLHYAKLKNEKVAQQLQENFPAEENKIQILEFFSYGCKGCRKLDRDLKDWLNGKENKYTLECLPVIFSKDWQKLAKTYFTLKAINAKASMHTLIFDAIHKQEIKTISDLEIFKLLNEKIDLEQFKEYYYSTKIEEITKKTNLIAKNLGIFMIPEILVKIDRNYYIISPILPKGSNHIAVIEQLSKQHITL